jgi:hypothetical protein
MRPVPSPRRRHGSIERVRHQQETRAGGGGDGVRRRVLGGDRLLHPQHHLFGSTASSSSGLQHHLFGAAPMVLVQGYTPEVLAITGSSPITWLPSSAAHNTQAMPLLDALIQTPHNANMPFFG